MMEAHQHSSEDKKTININSFSGLSREWVGVKFAPFLGKKGNTQTKQFQENAGTIPGHSCENFVYVFASLFFFRP